ncbi:hypothetical protein ANCCAN_18042 [Ancylostoma caninum]|uniref:CCDC92/74 N-terminal domain-containing protein n=1 Tax=Ancylostoma caninum TaxID=29170 RepID=A0A368FZ90_ANCCA|nr:hypothetical protein ANCCAN_18042 [Ancylostoma caninum]
MERSAPPYNVSLYESDLELRLREAIRQRDEQWRKHEREQITFLQNETAAMLRGLHKEIERLGHQLKDAKRQLYVPDDSPCDHSDMEAKIEQQEERIRQLELQIREKEQYATNVEDKVAEAVEKLQEQIDLQADRIRQLSAELNERNQTVAHLSSQLRTYRLRDAMATAQQRRRASSSNCSNASPIVSPSSPHRIFPPKGLLSASVTVSYPGSKSNACERSGSVDRILRRKSASSLRTYRLRDAMATAQQRRRASSSNCSNASPIVSPSSPHRIFPPKGLLSASVTVSYPGSKSNACERSGSVDRILRRKSASSVSMNKLN